MATKVEKIEENKFVAKVEARGWICFKLSTAGPYGKTGFNDRLVLAAYGVHAFFEFKRVGEEAEKLQAYRHKRLKNLGHSTYVVYFAEEAYSTLIRLVKAAKKSQEDKAKELSESGDKVRRLAASRRVLFSAGPR